MGLRTDMLVCTPLECETVEEMVSSMELAKREGADIVEMCLASISFSHISQLDQIFKLRNLPLIVSLGCREKRRNHSLSETTWLHILKRAVAIGVEFVEINYEARALEIISELKRQASNTKVIVSSYLDAAALTSDNLGDLIADMQSTTADVIKLVINVHYITDVALIFHVLTRCQV